MILIAAETMRSRIVFPANEIFREIRNLPMIETVG